VRRAFIVDLSSEAGAAADLSVGGVFIPNASVDFDDECQIVLRAGAEDVTVIARVVHITEAGAGFQIESMTGELRERIAALVELAKHVDLDLERKQTLTRALAETTERRAAGSMPPINRRMAEGSISPVVAAIPTQRDESLAEKIRAALAADAEPRGETDD
jgi:hypothetical protein